MKHQMVFSPPRPCSGLPWEKVASPEMDEMSGGFGALGASAPSWGLVNTLLYLIPLSDAEA